MSESLLDIKKREVSGISQKPKAIYRIGWLGSDPSPKDGTTDVQDWEFEQRRGKPFPITLAPEAREELKRRQIYYVLNGGVLGSLKEIPRDNDTIIVDLNIVYDKSQFTLEKAQKAIQKQIAFAEKVYGEIEIKFYIVWTAGTGDWKTFTIKEGRKDDYINIFLSIRDDKDAVSATSVIPGKTASEDIIKDIFLTQRQFEGRSGVSDYSLTEESLAHELGHKFGLVGDPSDKLLNYDVFLGFNIRNWVSDAEINSAIKMLDRNAVRKGINWGNLGKNRGLPSNILPSSMKEFWSSISTYDKWRIGARRLSKAN